MATFNYLLGKYMPDAPKRKNKKLPEAQICEQIDTYLKSIGAYMRTIKSDGRKLPNGRWIPSSQGKGISDRIGLVNGGRFLAVEVKAKGKRSTATSEQLEFLTKIIDLGGCGVVADSVECVKKALAMSKQELLDYLPTKKEPARLVDLDDLPF